MNFIKRDERFLANNFTLICIYGKKMNKFSIEI